MPPKIGDLDGRTDLAELHDIGKIVNWDAVGLRPIRNDGEPGKDPHDFEECIDPRWGIDFTSPVWEAMFRKDSPEQHPETARIRNLRLKHFPESSAWAIVSIGEELAAGMGRLREQGAGGNPVFGYHCLWTGKSEGDPRLTAESDLRQLISHLNGNPSWDETCRRYGRILHQRVETARPGLNVTTLYSHSVLSGKIARILAPLASAIRPDSNFPDAEKAVASRKFLTLSLEVLFPQQPFRTRDLSVFSARRDAIASAVSYYRDNVLIHYANHLLACFLSPEEADAFSQSFRSAGFVVAESRADRTLSYLLSPKKGITEAIRESPPAYRYPSIAAAIEPPICENCQFAHADHRWPAEYLARRTDISEAARARLEREAWKSLRLDDFEVNDRAKLAEWLEQWGEEYLCAPCFDLRCRPSPLTRLATWESGRIAWARVTLDLAQLETNLQELHAQYLHKVATTADLDPTAVPVRLPIVRDFVDQYEESLERWTAQVLATFGAANVERIDEGFVCVKLPEKHDALRILGLYQSLLVENFPRLMDRARPAIRLGISIAPAKHPFFVSWRFLESARAPIAIQLVGSGHAEIPANRLAETLTLIEQGDRRGYHRLRDIARTSKALAELVLADRTERDNGFQSLRRIMPLGMDFESLVTIANIAEGEASR